MEAWNVWFGLRTAGWAFCLLAVAGGAVEGQAFPNCESAVLTLGEAAALLRVDAEELERLAGRQEVPARRVGSSWRFDCARLIAWLAGDGGPLTASGDPVSAGPSPPAGADALARPDPSAIASTAGQDEPIGEAPEERSAEDIFLRGQRVLLGPGEVVLDFGQFYARNDVQELVTVGTGVGLGTTESETFTTLLVARVGVLNETEVFASTSFHSQDTHQFFDGARLASTGESDFAGLRVGVRRTLLREGAGRPDIIISLDGQIPTPDGASDASGGLILVKSVDPVVLFAGATWLHTFRRNLPDGTRFGPDDRIAVSMGYGLALNDTLAISASVSGLFGAGPGSGAATSGTPGAFSGRFGLTSWLAEGLYIEPSVSFGLSGPGQSVAFGVTVPYAF